MKSLSDQLDELQSIRGVLETEAEQAASPRDPVPLRLKLARARLTDLANAFGGGPATKAEVVDLLTGSESQMDLVEFLIADTRSRLEGEMRRPDAADQLRGLVDQALWRSTTFRWSLIVVLTGFALSAALMTYGIVVVVDQAQKASDVLAQTRAWVNKVADELSTDQESLVLLRKDLDEHRTNVEATSGDVEVVLKKIRAAEVASSTLGTWSDQVNAVEERLERLKTSLEQSWNLLVESRDGIATAHDGITTAQDSLQSINASLSRAQDPAKAVAGAMEAAIQSVRENFIAEATESLRNESVRLGNVEIGRLSLAAALCAVAVACSLIAVVLALRRPTDPGSSSASGSGSGASAS